MNEQLIVIRDDLKEKPKLGEVLDLSSGRRIDRIIGHSIPGEVVEYVKAASDGHKAARRARLTDEITADKLYFILSTIDRTLLTSTESDLYGQILDRYRVGIGAK